MTDIPSDAVTRLGAQLAQECDRRTQLATAAERSRIAHELHDVLSHSLTVMVALADGASAQFSSAPACADAAIQQVAEAGRQAIHDLRGLLGMLDEPDKSLGVAPQPGTDDLPALVRRMRQAGLPVEFETTGAAPRDEGLQLAIYRIVQESLTNVLRHAPEAKAVTACVDYSDDLVRIRVHDTGAPASAAPRGSGRGLAGIRARVALYGGEVESGRVRRGGWRVNAALRTGAHAKRTHQERKWPRS